MKRFVMLFILLHSACHAQTEICWDETDRLQMICLDTSQGEFTRIEHEGENYNYVERDSTGGFQVLGNLNRRGRPVGMWTFFLGDVTRNGKMDWFQGKVKRGYLHGIWAYSYICLRRYSMGREINPQPCPNI